MPKLDAQQSSLLDQLDALNERRLCAPFPPIRERPDADTVSAIQKVQQIALTMRDADGIPRPTDIPSPLAPALPDQPTVRAIEAAVMAMLGAAWRGGVRAAPPSDGELLQHGEVSPVAREPAPLPPTPPRRPPTLGPAPLPADEAAAERAFRERLARLTAV
jgi:hypothetical protein